MLREIDHHRQRAILRGTIKKPTLRIRLDGKSNVLRDPQNFDCLGTVVSRAKRSRRHARRRLRDATLYSPLDTRTRPLDPLRSRRNDPSRPSFAFGDFLPRNDISSPQTDIFFRTKGSTSLPFLLARARVFSGPRRLFHRSSSFPSRGRTRARTRRRDGSFDEKSILSSKVKKHHT